MSNNLISKGQVTRRWNAYGSQVLGFSIEISHSGLSEHKVIKAPEMRLLDIKVDEQLRKWETKWNNLVDINEKALNIASNKQKAEILTEEASKATSKIESLLKNSMKMTVTVDWNSLVSETVPSIEERPPKPKRKQFKSKPAKPEPIFVYKEPKETDPKYTPKIGFFSLVFGKKQDKIDQSKKVFSEDHQLWLEEKERACKIDQEQMEKYKRPLAKWQGEKEIFDQREDDVLALWEKENALWEQKKQK